MDEASFVYLLSIRFEQRDQVFAPFQLVCAYFRKKKKKIELEKSNPILSLSSFFPFSLVSLIRETRPITAMVLEN